MDEAGRTGELVDGFVQQVRSLGDEDLRELALARGALDETFHSGAWRGAVEILADRAEIYARAWNRIGPVYVPDRLAQLVRMGMTADPVELAEWQDIARLARLALDDALMALLTADSIRPPDIRELYAPWKKMLEAAHGRGTAAT